MVPVNIIALILSGVVAMVIGFAWYSMGLFGRVWMKEIGMSESTMKDRQKRMGPMYGLMIISALVMAYVLAVVIQLTGLTGLIGGLRAGFWVWLGFIATYASSLVIFEGRSWRWFGISAGYYLVTLLLMGLIIGAMR